MEFSSYQRGVVYHSSSYQRGGIQLLALFAPSYHTPRSYPWSLTVVSLDFILCIAGATHVLQHCYSLPITIGLTIGGDGARRRQRQRNLDGASAKVCEDYDLRR